MKYARVFLAFLLLIGCSNNGKSDNTQSEANEIRVEKIDTEKLSQLLNNRDGKALLINVWATWCVPCREEFSDLVKLADDFRKSEIEIIGISADYPDEVESKIVPFLKENEANFVNYVQDFENDEDLINMLHEDWNGALPATFIFDETGRRISSLFGKQSIGRLKQEISLL